MMKTQWTSVPDIESPERFGESKVKKLSHGQVRRLPES